MRPTLVLLTVGLTPRHLGPDTPRLSRLAAAGGMRPLETITPAVTCSVQATFMTGLLPRQHGIVGNGWLFRDLMEIWFWRQSNRLVDGEKIWEAGKRRDPSFTCANLFWWYNMAGELDDRRDAAPDLQGRRAQAPRLLHQAGGIARRAHREARARSRCSSSGGPARPSPRRGGSPRPRGT